MDSAFHSDIYYWAKQQYRIQGFSFAKEILYFFINNRSGEPSFNCINSESVFKKY